jgi:hypothetical protein
LTSALGGSDGGYPLNRNAQNIKERSGYAESFSPGLIFLGGVTMYGVHITFGNGHEPVTRFRMSRKDYCGEMLKWQIDYDLEIERVEEFSTGDTLIFYNAHERLKKRLATNIERMKSRARYYSRTASGAGKSSRARSGAQG